MNAHMPCFVAVHEPQKGLKVQGQTARFVLEAGPFGALTLVCVFLFLHTERTNGNAGCVKSIHQIKQLVQRAGGYTVPCGNTPCLGKKGRGDKLSPVRKTPSSSCFRPQNQACNTCMLTSGGLETRPRRREPPPPIKNTNLRPRSGNPRLPLLPPRCHLQCGIIDPPPPPKLSRLRPCLITSTPPPSAQMFELSLLEVGTVLRLDRGAWSFDKAKQEWCSISKGMRGRWLSG